MCGIADIKNVGEPIDVFTNEDTQRLIAGVYLGVITVENLDLKTYTLTAETLMSNVYDGYGKQLPKPKLTNKITDPFVLEQSPDGEMLQDLRENVYIFSGAKSYQMTRELTGMLTDGDKTLTFAEFKKLAEPKIIDYNVNYLRAEYNSAWHQARSASQWQEFERTKEDYPNLRYETVGDQRVRFDHAKLDGIIRPIDDKFWGWAMPPNAWGCRCTVEREDGEAKSTDMRGFKIPDTVPELFRFNSGKDRIIFSKEHPYFNVAKKDKGLAKKNFNLPKI